jgi:prophage regulatory protein
LGTGLFRRFGGAEVAEKILRRPAVQQITGKSRSQIYDDMQKGTFPRQVSLSPGGHAVGWLESEITAWMAERVAERDKRIAKRAKRNVDNGAEASGVDLPPTSPNEKRGY